MGGGIGSYFPYILLNDIQTMFSQLAKRQSKALPADLCTDRTHNIIAKRQRFLRRNKNMAVNSSRRGVLCSGGGGGVDVAIAQEIKTMRSSSKNRKVFCII